jgi:hypothetical protein
MYDPPPGFPDLEHDAGLCDRDGSYRSLDVPGVGTLLARLPLPKSVSAISMAANSKLDAATKAGYLNLFVRNHVGDDTHEDLLRGMITGDYPDDALQKVARAIACVGTPRPTRPSSRSRC